MPCGCGKICWYRLSVAQPFMAGLRKKICDYGRQEDSAVPFPAACLWPHLGAAIIGGRSSVIGIPPMALPLEQVVKQVADSGIIAPGKLEDFIPPKADPRTPEELVQALVKSENLTAFQGQQVKSGKAKALILGEYTILDKIGAGGMGQVFKARHGRQG